MISFPFISTYMYGVKDVTHHAICPNQLSFYHSQKKNHEDIHANLMS